MRNDASIVGMVLATAPETRWQLYRLLAEPARLRLLALAAEEELSLSELAELLDESQPNVSRHAGPLRQAGLLAERRQGTRTLVRLAQDACADAVVADAVSAGRELCNADGSLLRVAAVVRARDLKTREFFAEPPLRNESLGIAVEVPAYLSALSLLMERRGLAVDAGTGDGALLDVLAPLFDRVIALDRSEAQLARAAERVRVRGYANVSLFCAELDAEEVQSAAEEGADVVIASRVLHHAPLPREAVRSLAALLRPGGRLLVIDYCRHADEALRDAQADVWMGFEERELIEFATAAGLCAAKVQKL